MPGRHWLETDRLVLRLADVDDAPDVIAYNARNADHLRPWEPTRDPATANDVELCAASLARRRADPDADRGGIGCGRARH